MSTSASCGTHPERTGVVTFKTKPMTLIGPHIKPGDKAPDFEVLGQDLAPVGLGAAKGKALVLNVVTSLDTGICDQQTRRFNEEAAKLPNVEIFTISMDLPFAQKRWCGAAGIDKIKVLSDHRRASFGKAYGVLMKEMRLLARSIFVVDASGTVRHAEYVPEVATHPNYDAALAAAKQAK